MPRFEVPPNKKLEIFNEAAKYYKVIRNFPIINESKRLSKALDIVLNVQKVTEMNLLLEVNSLADLFFKEYGKRAISAATKFLWIRFRSPIIIYDQNALKYLQNINKRLSFNSPYGEYREVWLSEFKKYNSDIDIACQDLKNVIDYSLAPSNLTEIDISAITNCRWFKERVFDKYLWFNANLINDI